MRIVRGNRGISLLIRPSAGGSGRHVRDVRLRPRRRSQCRMEFAGATGNGREYRVQPLLTGETGPAGYPDRRGGVVVTNRAVVELTAPIVMTEFI
ncbi:unnamed protein product, partial [Nesidiocoris tenuis]